MNAMVLGGLSCVAQLLECRFFGNTGTVRWLGWSSEIERTCAVLLYSFKFCLCPPLCPQNFVCAPPLTCIHWHICVRGFNSSTASVMSAGFYFSGSVEDYWEGYKAFCYAYYSHSVPHESAFRATKLGS